MSEQTGTDVTKKNVSKFAKSFLNPLSETIEIQAKKCFVAREYFVVNTTDEAKMKIANIGGDFQKYFLPKVEENETEARLAVEKITKSVTSSFLINVLGGERNAEIKLSEFYAAFEKQSSGEDGPLITDGHTNLAYIRDISSSLWAVHGFWFDGGWQFGVSQCFCTPRVWFEDDQVLYRKLPCQVFNFN